MRAVNSQTPNGIKAIYTPDARPTPIRRSPEGLTLNVGGNCEHPNGNYPSKTTKSRSPGDKYPEWRPANES
jgi:hypothetical protein